MAFLLLIKAEKGTNTVRQCKSIKQHKQRELVKKEKVQKHDEDLWNVHLASKTGTVHHVRRIGSPCSRVFHCSSCDACVHIF